MDRLMPRSAPLWSEVVAAVGCVGLAAYAAWKYRRP